MKHLNNKKYFPLFIFIALLLLLSKESYSWGFYSHRVINRHAVFCLPPQMLGFYKNHIEYLTEHSVAPDKMSHVNPEEAPRHYIDIDHFGENPFALMPIFWNAAVEKFSEDTLKKHGILPWYISKMLTKLTQAFKDENPTEIIRLSAHIGHYIADATVPLHTTKYYNGRTPEQRGIHAFWETRLPELYAKDYDFFVGRATYIENGQKKAWELVKESHFQVDTVYMIYEYLIDSLPSDKVFVYDTRGTITKRNYSLEFSSEFVRLSKNMIERNIRRAVHAVASYWYTAWVNAGQPDLNKLLDKEMIKDMKKKQKELDHLWKHGEPVGRPNPEE